MEITRLSTKGQIVLPQSIRVSKAWESGTEFSVEETADGVLLRPLRRFPETRLEDIAGCLRFSGRAKTVAEMDAAVGREVRRRHDRRRH